MTNKLIEAKNLLVRRWGEMGGYWGISRTMAEIHALLFVTREPLCTDDVMAQLHVSRGNASMNLRALVDWGLIKRVHKLGDRKEYFQADTDVWHMFETIMRERRRREVEPIIDTIDRCAVMVREPDPAEAEQPAAPEDVEEFQRRIDELRSFLSGMGMLFELVLRFGKEGIAELTGVLDAAAPPTDGNTQASAGARKNGSSKAATSKRNRPTAGSRR